MLGQFSLQDWACITGLILSGYALYVELKKKHDPKYVAMCDFGNNMQCSRVLTSEYSQGFGLVRHLVGTESVLNVPNCITGLVFYAYVMFMDMWSDVTTIALTLYVLAAIACLMSIYLAYILVFVLKDLCIVCIATYCVNFVLLYTTHNNYAIAYI